jgi:hypothetical protein
MDPEMNDRREGAHRDEDDLGLDELESVFVDLRAAFVRPAEPAVAAEHLARMDAAARETDALAPAVAPVGTSEVEVERSSLRRRLAVVGAAAAAVLFGVGGLGYAGALPGPVQDAVASIAEPFGVDLPRSDDPPAADGSNETDDPSSGAGNGARSDEDPGQSGEAPGQSGDAPGQSEEAPGQSGEAPGQTGETPSSAAVPPGQSGETPGQSGSAPGQSGEAPGNSGDAPGQTGETPGNAGGNSANSNANDGNSANSNAGGNSANSNAGGNSADAPGQNK